MICLTMCSLCVHNREEKKDGWIPTCDAYPNGQPLLDKEFDKELEQKSAIQRMESDMSRVNLVKNGWKNPRCDRYKKFFHKIRCRVMKYEEIRLQLYEGVD